MFFLSSLDSSTSQFRTERIKMPPARYPRSTGSDRGGLAALSRGRQEVPPEPRIWNHTLLLFLSRVPLAFRVQQPNTSNVPHQPGDIILHQQPITGLHFCSTQDLGQSRCSWRQAEGRVSLPFTPMVAAPYSVSFWLRARSWEASYYQNAEPHFGVWFISVLCCSPLNL